MYKHLRGYQIGFTLIELMIVVAIIGILAAVAIPSYQGYIARTQTTEAVLLTGALKSNLVAFYSARGVWPDSVTMLNATASGEYVDQIDFTVNNSNGTIVIKATMKTTGISAAIANRNFLLSSVDGGKTWLCGALAEDADPTIDIPQKYLPSTCK